MKKRSVIDTALHVLLVEDELAHVDAIRRAFENANPNTTVQVAGTLREYRELAVACPPDIAVIDLNLPDGRAIEVLTFPPEDGSFPIVVMTSYGNEEIAVEIMKSGALDYVVKSPEGFAGIPHIAERVRREWNLLQ